MKFVLLIAAALTIESQIAWTQEMACHTIRRGDTVAQVALRLTGNADDRSEPWFQILDPAASRFVSKAYYDHIRPGWRACIIRSGASTTVRPELASVSSNIDLNLVLWAALVAAIALAGGMAGEHLQHRETVVQAMKIFGERFISEFERPLIHPGREEPMIQSRLRFHPGRGQLDVWLAPGTGRHYPNLLDHKQNVLYDVGRIMQTLVDQPFAVAPLYANGRWVVVPFQLKSSNPGRWP